MFLSRFFLVLALVAMLVRAMTPAGYMVSADEEGWLQVEICSTNSSHITWFNPATGETSDAPDDAPEPIEAPCAFSSLTALDRPADPIGLQNPLYQTLLGAQPIARNVVHQRPRTFMPPSRGPPLQA